MVTGPLSQTHYISPGASVRGETAGGGTYTETRTGDEVVRREFSSGGQSTLTTSVNVQTGAGQVLSATSYTPEGKIATQQYPVAGGTVVRDYSKGITTAFGSSMTKVSADTGGTLATFNREGMVTSARNAGGQLQTFASPLSVSAAEAVLNQSASKSVSVAPAIFSGYTNAGFEGLTFLEKYSITNRTKTNLEMGIGLPYIKSPNVYSADTSAPLGFSTLPEWLTRASRKQEYTGQKESQEMLSRTGIFTISPQSVFAFGTGALSVAATVVTNPPKFIANALKSTVQLIKSPFGTIQKGVEQFSLAPYSTAGEIAGGVLVTKAIFKGASTVKFKTFSVPDVTGAPEALWKGISIEAGGKSQPLFGITMTSAEGSGRFSLFTPSVDLGRAAAPFGNIGTGFVFESPTETKIFMKNFPKIAAAGEAEKFSGLFKITSSTARTPSAFIQERFIAETKSLSPTGVREVIKFAQGEENIELYGSFGARQQMPSDLARVSADIDMQFKLSAVETTAKANQLVLNLQKIGENVRISTTSPTLIESFSGGKWVHAVDIHSLDDALTSLGSSFKGTALYSLPLGQKTIDIQGLPVMPLSEQGVRKFGSIATVRPAEGFTLAPESWRIKDIPDWFAVEETLIRSKGSSLNLLNKVKSMYPAELFTTTTSAVKIPLLTTELPSAGGLSFSPVSLGIGLSLGVGASVSPSLSFIGSAVSLPSYLQRGSSSISAYASITSKISSPSYALSSISSVRISSPSITSPPSRPSSPSSPYLLISPSSYALPSISSPSMGSPSISSPYVSLPSYASISPSLPSYSRPSPSSYGYGFPPPPTPKPILGFINPELDETKKAWHIPSTKKVTSKHRYVPSVQAIVFNIRGKKPGEYLVRSGLGLRPMVR